MNIQREIGLAVQKATKELENLIILSEGPKHCKALIWEWTNYDKYMLPHIDQLCREYHWIKKRLDNNPKDIV